MNPIIFLDFDGVLNNHDCLKAWYKKHGDNDAIDRYCARALRKVLDAGPFDVVISSTWRLFYTDNQLKKYLADAGCPDVNIVGQTPSTMDAHRGREINAWMRNNNFDPTRSPFLILDDNQQVGMFPEFEKHWIQTSIYDTGFRARHVFPAIRILAGNLTGKLIR